MKLFVGGVVFILFTIPLANYAQEACGNIITIEEDGAYAEPIEDCAFPFGPIQTNENLEIFFQDIKLENGGVYEIARQSGQVIVPNASPYTFGTIYKHQENDYIVVGHIGESLTFATGTYSIYVSEIELSFSYTTLQKVKHFFFNTAHAAAGDATLITFEVTEPLPPEPEVDPLILQYAPILYFHPEEDYFPMDVNSYIEASALWDQGGTDTQLYSSSSLTFDVFENLVASGIDTSDMYLAFSDPDTQRSINLENAKLTYQNIKKDKPTVYYHKMTDETDYGKVFTVLQYWYFYAMNNWKDKVSGSFTNNHEGDWESTFVFLNDNEEPEYVAYSSHLNDGLQQYVNGQYASVRRKWSELSKVNDNPVVFVALGSHANYFSLGNGGSHDVGSGIDKVSLSGDNFLVNNFLKFRDRDVWTNYLGSFGTFTDELGSNGPQGPRFINVTGQARFEQPIEWAGLNNFFKLAVNTATDTVEDTKQGIKMVFDTLLNVGTNIIVERYDEYITFGTNVAQFNPLPYFFEVTSDTETSGVTMTLSYDPDYVESISQLAEDLVILYYNPATDLVEVLDSVVDIEAHTVTAYTPHLSRYLLGFQEKEVIEDPDASATTTPQIEPPEERHHYGGRIRKDVPEPQVLGASTASAEGQIEQIEILVQRITKLLDGTQVHLTEDQKGVLLKILEELADLLNNFN